MDNNNDHDGNRQWSKASEDILKCRYPLHKACREGDIEALSLLIVPGQHNILLEDEFYGWTPAHWAAYFGKLACLRRVMHILSTVLSTEPLSSRYQQSPLHLAAYAGHPSCLEWLINAGADIQKPDYLGETAVHKAARTGSMECVSLLAARQADLNLKSNCGMMPSELAAQCGYPDCALYLRRAAEQQLLKSRGLIAETVLPVVHMESVLPGQRPDIGVISQGLNGGCLPHSIESQFVPRTNPSMDMDMECAVGDSHCINGSGDHLGNGVHNGNGFFNLNGLNTQANATLNGFHPHVNPTANGLNTHTNGFHSHTNGLAHGGGLHKDVLLSQDVSTNRAPVAGRKRGREVVDDEQPSEWKRVRHLAMEVPAEPMPLGTPYQPCSVQALSSSIDEHVERILAQQGYDSLLYESMLRDYHGA